MTQPTPSLDPTAPRSTTGGSVGDNRGPAQTPTSQPVLIRVLWSALGLTVALALIAGVVGYTVVGMDGLWGALIGAAVGGAFMAMSAGSIAFANRFVASPMFVPIFFGSVLGAMLLKIVIFLVVVFALTGREGIHDRTMLMTIIAGILASLAIELTVVLRSRISAVSDVTLYE